MYGNIDVIGALIVFAFIALLVTYYALYAYGRLGNPPLITKAEPEAEPVYTSPCGCGKGVPWVNGAYADGNGLYCDQECLDKYGEHTVAEFCPVCGARVCAHRTTVMTSIDLDVL